MQNIIDDNYLNQLNVIKNGEYRDYLGGRISQLLNIRVANRVTEILDDNQVDQLMSLPDDQRMNWLQTNIANFDSIVDEELNGIITDMKAVMPSLKS